MIMTGQCPTPLKTKKRRKKVVSTVLAVSMLCTLAPATVIAAPQAKAPVYSDVTDKAWYKEAVDYVTNERIARWRICRQIWPTRKSNSWHGRHCHVASMWRTSK